MIAFFLLLGRPCLALNPVDLSLEVGQLARLAPDLLLILFLLLLLLLLHVGDEVLFPLVVPGCCLGTGELPGPDVEGHFLEVLISLSLLCLGAGDLPDLDRVEIRNPLAVLQILLEPLP
eukprot:6060890-Heterocapsa_arctica.AAC.1